MDPHSGRKTVTTVRILRSSTRQRTDPIHINLSWCVKLHSQKVLQACEITKTAFTKSVAGLRNPNPKIFFFNKILTNYFKICSKIQSPVRINKKKPSSIDEKLLPYWFLTGHMIQWSWFHIILYLIVDLPEGGRHLVGERAGHNDDVSLTRRRAENDPVPAFQMLKSQMNLRVKAGLRIRIGSGFNRVSGSGFGIQMRIHGDKNDPQK